MDIRKFFVGRAVVLLILLIIGLIVAGFYALNSYIYKEKQADNTAHEPYRATLTGVQTCLPHKDTSGPQTLECAIGMQTDAGEYYALDFMLMSQIPPVIQNGQRFTASGLVTPIERLSTDHWQKYNIEGVFSVTDSVRIEGISEASTFSWIYEKDATLNPDGQPQTNIFLEVKYLNGLTDKKFIATTPGGCNDLPDKESDSVHDSTNVQCYYAGLGYRFKITKGETSYLVKRKTFEEASPDYNPPVSSYVVVAEFPLSK